MQHQKKKLFLSKVTKLETRRGFRRSDGGSVNLPGTVSSSSAKATFRVEGGRRCARTDAV